MNTSLNARNPLIRLNFFLQRKKISEITKITAYDKHGPDFWNLLFAALKKHGVTRTEKECAGKKGLIHHFKW